MKKKYLISLILAVMLGCSACASEENEVETQIVHDLKIIENVPDTVDTITVYDTDGNIIYQFDSIASVKLKLRDDELSVVVPAVHDSCFED